MSEWKEVRLGELCEIFAGGDAPKGKVSKIKTEQFSVPIYSNGITEEGLYGYTDKARVYDPATTITARGTIGVAFRRKAPYFPIVRLISVIGKKDMINSDFLYYCLRNTYIDGEGSVQAQLTVPMISNYRIAVPSLSTQHRIASILSALDDKIAVNRRICENLESQAQALFKHWFIDFAPFKDGKFVESELGMIPEGWRVLSIDDVFNIKYGRNLPATKIEEIGDYPVYGANGIMGYYNDYNYDNYVTLITSRGSGSGDVSRTLHKKSFITNNSFAVTPKEQYAYFSNGYTFYFIKNINFKPYCSGSAQPQLTNASISAISIILPDKDNIKKYNNLADEILYVINKTHRENLRLSTLRDTLLPKLMSGQIKV